MNEFIKVSLQSDSTNLQKGFAGASAAVSTFRKGVDAVRGSLSRVDADIKSLGHKALGAAAGLSAAVYSATKAAADFEVQMRNVNSILQQNEKQFQGTNQQVLQLSRQLPKSASDLAGGLYDIASAGFQGAAGINVLHQAGIAATAGLADTSTAAGAITAVLNAYGLSADHAADVSDILFQTVNVGVLTFDDLAQQLGDIVPLGQAAGIQFDVLAAGIAALTRNGFPAAQAATALTGVIRGFIKPSQEMTNAVKALGFESAQTMLKQLGLQGSLEKLNESVKGDVGAWGQLIQDTEGLRGALSLVSNGGQVFSESLQTIASGTARAGAAQKAYAEQSKSLNNEIQLFKNALTDLRIEIGQYYLPIVSHLVGMGSSLLKFFTDLPGPLKAIIAYGTLAGTAVAALGAYFLLAQAKGFLFNKAINASATAQRLFGTQSRTVTASLINVAKNFDHAGKAAVAAGRTQSMFGVGVRAVLSPVKSAAAGVASLTARYAASGTGGRLFSSAASGVSNAAMRVATSTREASLATEGWGSTMSRVSAKIRFAGTVLNGFSNIVGAFRRHLGEIATVGFAAISIMQQWNAVRQQAQGDVQGLISDEAAKKDMTTLQGMQQGYADLKQQLDELQSEEPVSNIGSNIKGGLQTLGSAFGITDNNVQRVREKVIALSDDLNAMRAQFKEAQQGLTDLSYATGQSTTALEMIAKASDIDVTKLKSLKSASEWAATSAIILYQQHKISRAELEKFGESSGDVNVQLFLQATASKDSAAGINALSKQLEAINNPLQAATDGTMELTDAQKTLKQAIEDIGSAQDAFSTMLSNRKDAVQKEVDAETQAMQDRNEAQKRADQDASDARIKAAQDEVDKYHDGTKRHKQAQDQLDALRKVEQDRLEADGRARDAELKKQEDSLKDSVDRQKLSLDDYINALTMKNAEINTYQQNLVGLTSRLTPIFGAAGAKQIVQYLAGLGKQGEDLVSQLMSGTDDQLSRMGTQIITNVKSTSDQTAVEIDAGMKIAAQAGQDGAKATREGILKELGFLPGDADNVMKRFGQTIENQMNTIITGLGGTPIKFNFENSPQSPLPGLGGGIPYGAPGFDQPAGPALPPAPKPGEPGFIGPMPPPSQSSSGRRVKYQARGSITYSPRAVFGEAGPEAYIPFTGDRRRNIGLWEETGRALGLMPMQRSTTVQNIKHESSRTNRWEFTGDMYLSDPEATIKYAERKKRLAKVRGIN